MNKEDLKIIINSVFLPVGYKQKNNNWVKNTCAINKIIHLQTGYTGMDYYINYGFVIVGLPLLEKMHLERRVASNNKKVQKRITELLDLESPIDDDLREKELNEILKALVSKIDKVESAEDLKIQILEDEVECLLPRYVADYLRID